MRMVDGKAASSSQPTRKETLSHTYIFHRGLPPSAWERRHFGNSDHRPGKSVMDAYLPGKHESDVEKDIMYLRSLRLKTRTETRKRQCRAEAMTYHTTSEQYILQCPSCDHHETTAYAESDSILARRIVLPPSPIGLCRSLPLLLVVASPPAGVLVAAL